MKLLIRIFYTSQSYNKEYAEDVASNTHNVLAKDIDDHGKKLLLYEDVLNVAKATIEPLTMLFSSLLTYRFHPDAFDVFKITTTTTTTTTTTMQSKQTKNKHESLLKIFGWVLLNKNVSSISCICNRASKLNVRHSHLIKLI